MKNKILHASRAVTTNQRQKSSIVSQGLLGAPGGGDKLELMSHLPPPLDQDQEQVFIRARTRRDDSHAKIGNNPRSRCVCHSLYIGLDWSILYVGVDGFLVRVKDPQIRDTAGSDLGTHQIAKACRAWSWANWPWVAWKKFRRHRSCRMNRRSRVHLKVVRRV